MISVVNKGEETGSNLFVIAIACVMLPSFLYAVENRMASLIRTGSVALLLLTVLSLVRLVNRIERTPENSQHYHYPLGFGKWDSLYPCCNHENI